MTTLTDAVASATTKQYSQSSINYAVAVEIHIAELVVEVKCHLLTAWRTCGDGAQPSACSNVSKGVVSHHITALSPRTSNVEAYTMVPSVK
jgi:hypothetical protein